MNCCLKNDIYEWIRINSPEHVNDSNEEKIRQVVTKTWDKKEVNLVWAHFLPNEDNVAPKTKYYCEKDIASWIVNNMET